jgi:methyl-accepting chemotaxis protein
MRLQSEEVSKAMDEQARAMRDMTTASSDVAKQIAMVTKANLEHSSGAENILRMLSDIRQITDRNARGVGLTLTETDALLEQANQINSLIVGLRSVEEPEQQPARANGRKPRRKTSTPVTNGTTLPDDKAGE